MNQQPKISSDREWAFGFIIIITFQLFNLALLLVVGLLMSMIPNYFVRVGMVVVLSLAGMGTIPILVFRICRHFVHVAEQED